LTSDLKGPLPLAAVLRREGGEKVDVKPKSTEKQRDGSTPAQVYSGELEPTTAYRRGWFIGEKGTGKGGGSIFHFGLSNVCC
jgi:hypothetical protein